MSILTDLREDLADWWRRFWNQPDKAFRNFHIAYFLLGMHFIVFALSYVFNWQGAVAGFDLLGQALGAERHYRPTEVSYMWRVLAVANVFTLGFMCLTIEANVRRFYPLLLPLCVLKGTAAIGFLSVYLFRYHFPGFLAVSIWDAANVVMLLYFGYTARWSVEEWGEEVLVPRLMLKEQ